MAPGDYHETDDETHPPTDCRPRGLRRCAHHDVGHPPAGDGPEHGRRRRHQGGLDHGRAAGIPAQQSFGAVGSSGKAEGRNGIVVWKANDVSIENLTACNFLGGAGDAGNEIWWNGGDGSGLIGLHGYTGRYLTATSTYYGGEATAAQYGIFSSNSRGPGVVGPALRQQLQRLRDVRGRLPPGVRHHHRPRLDGVQRPRVLGHELRWGHRDRELAVRQQQGRRRHQHADRRRPPAPQNGDCPGHATSPITHTRSCWVFIHNSVHDNNNPNVPQAGSASAGPTGTGMTVSGGTNDTVMDNTFANNGAWGILFVPYPDSNPPVLGQTCAGTGGAELTGFGCVYDPKGDALLDNTFTHDAYFGNPSNADFGQIVINGGGARNCFAGQHRADRQRPDRPRAEPAHLQRDRRGGQYRRRASGQVLCDTGFGTSCPAGSHYPQLTAITMHPLPGDLPSMPNPCQGVPDNAWCPNGRPA